jgi:hypothetical protein
MGFLQDLERFGQGGFDRGDTTNPFARLSQTLGGRLSRQAGLFGEQQQQALLSGGRFDPAMAASARQRAFGSAQSALSSGLANLAGQEGQFLEQQRQFNVGEGGRRFLGASQLSLQERELQAMLEAAKPNWMDAAIGIGGLLPGIGSIFSGVAGLKGLLQPAEK